MHEVIQHVGIVQRLDCWRLEAGKKKFVSLEAYAASKPSLDDLRALANQVALNQVVKPDDLEMWSMMPPEERDQNHENMLQRQRDFLLYEETSHAMNAGDIGRVETMFESWIFTFLGSGKHKYAVELMRYLADVHFKQHVLFEQILNLPRNEGFDAVKRNEPVLKNYQALAEIDLSLCRGVFLDLGINQKTSKSHENHHARFEAQEIRSTLDKMTESALAAAVQEHFVNEPLFAKADACVLFPITLLKPMESVSETGVAYSAALRSDCSSENGSPPVLSKASAEQASELTCPLPEPLPVKGENCLPILVTQYGRARRPLYQPLHQTAISCVASLKFAHILGLADIAVFGLVVTGSVGQVIMCWNDPPVKESEGLTDGNDGLEFCDTRDQTYLLVRNVESFDISDPVQCFHFATILLRLAKYGHEVTEQVQRHAVDNRRDLAMTFFTISQGSPMDWTMEAQSVEFKPD